MTLTRAIEGAKDGSVVMIHFRSGMKLFEITGGHEFEEFEIGLPLGKVTPAEFAALRAVYPKKFKEMKDNG